MRPIAALLLAALLAPASAAARQKPDAPAAPAAIDPALEAAARMQRFYEASRDLHARFTQEQRSPIAGVKQASGELWLRKPGRMRFVYEKPDRKLMVADGKVLWVYEEEDQQAFRHDLKGSSLPSSVSFLLGSGRLGDEFDISAGTPDPAHPLEPGDVLLKLVPKKATAQYRFLEFVVDGKTYMVKQTVLHDQQGGESRMRFLDVEVNKGAPDRLFTFTPPPGTRMLNP